MEPIVEWIIGGFLLALYAFSRFNTPASNRSSTTVVRYYFAALSYFLALLLLFVLIGGGLTESRSIAALFLQDTTSTSGKKLPGPLLAALFLTALLPNFPVLSKLDDWLREIFHEMGSIPWTARRLSGRVRRASYEVPARLLPEIRQNLPGFDESEIQTEEEDSIHYRWIRLTAMYLQVRSWPDLKRYDHFVGSVVEDFKRIQDRYERLRPKALTCFRIARESADTEAMFAPVAECKRNLDEQMEELRRAMCDFIARGVLRCELSRSERERKLEAMGFTGVFEETEPLDANQVVTVGMVTFVIILVGILLAGRAKTNRGLFIAAMVGTIYAVAVVASIQPKTVWSFANVRKTGQRPTLVYLLSGCIAVILAAIVSVTFKYVWFRDFVAALKDVRMSYPWFVLSFVLAFATAFLADDFALARRWRWWRWIEGVALSAVMTSTSFLVYLMLHDVPGIDPKRIPSWGSLAVSAAFVGFVIGACVPHWYRNAPLRSEEREEAHPLKQIVASPVSGPQVT